MFFFFDTFSFKMVQIFLPIVVYTQWIFNYIQQWNNVGKIAIEKQSTELAVTNPVSNNKENGKLFFLLNSQPSLSPFLFNNKRSSVNTMLCGIQAVNRAKFVAVAIALISHKRTKIGIMHNNWDPVNQWES